MPQRTNTLTLGTDRALYVGGIPATGWHCHASPVLLMGLSGRFALHWGDRAGGDLPQRAGGCWGGASVRPLWRSGGAGVPGAGFAGGTQPAQRVPAAGWGAAGCGGASGGACGHGGLFACLRSTGRCCTATCCKAAPPLDPRVAHSLHALRRPQHEQGRLARAGLASGAQLSASRFNHLFRAEMGVSLRSYRVWSQVRLAMGRAGGQPAPDGCGAAWGTLRTRRISAACSARPLA